MPIFIKMKQKIEEKIEIPEGIEVEVEGKTLKVKGPEGENSRTFKLHNIEMTKQGNDIVLFCERATKTEKKMINTTKAHIQNILEGVREKFVYELKVCFSHFPMTLDKKETKVIIKNFLGEKIGRNVKIPKGAEIEIQKEFITVKSIDKEIAGQAAANFEAATRITNRDRRIFQDGIYIIKKNGREI